MKTSKLVDSTGKRTIADIAGDRYGHLVAMSYVGRNSSGKSIWECRCDCGNTTRATANHLRSGAHKSCGCSNFRAPKPPVHGHYVNDRPSPTYSSWTSMRSRCLNPRVPDFHRYGGRGITICERWNRFENFLADMGERPRNTTLDRIDVNGPYSPDNCRWATHEMQVNNRRPNRMVTAFGSTKPLASFCREYHRDSRTILDRVGAGMTFEEALTAKNGNRWHRATVLKDSRQDGGVVR